jgi:hypothetical protein
MCFFAITFLMISTAQSEEAIRKELLKNIKVLWQAWQSYNPEPFKQWMSPDAVIVTAQGSMELSEFLEQLSSKMCQVKSFSVDQAARLTKIDDNTYVITYKAEQDAVCAGTKSPSPVVVSEVWSKKDGKWKAYFYQETDLLSPV